MFGGVNEMPTDGYKNLTVPKKLVVKIEQLRKRRGYRSWRETVEASILKDLDEDLTEKNGPGGKYTPTINNNLRETTHFTSEFPSQAET